MEERPAPNATRAIIERAIADPSRPEADRAADAHRRPLEVLLFAGIQPGERVADVMPGRGYATRLFSGVVGERGNVVALVPPWLADAFPKNVETLRAMTQEPSRANTRLVVAEIGAFDAGGALDHAWIALNYHDIVGRLGEDEARAAMAGIFRALRSGGSFVVVDHAAKSGRGARDANTLHRIDAATVVEHARDAGFVADGHSDVLANPHDPRIEPVFTAELSGQTDKFVLKFRKP